MPLHSGAVPELPLRSGQPGHRVRPPIRGRLLSDVRLRMHEELANQGQHVRPKTNVRAARSSPLCDPQQADALPIELLREPRNLGDGTVGVEADRICVVTASMGLETKQLLRDLSGADVGCVRLAESNGFPGGKCRRLVRCNTKSAAHWMSALEQRTM